MQHKTPKAPARRATHRKRLDFRPRADQGQRVRAFAVKAKHSLAWTLRECVHRGLPEIEAALGLAGLRKATP